MKKPAWVRRKTEESPGEREKYSSVGESALLRKWTFLPGRSVWMTDTSFLHQQFFFFFFSFSETNPSYLLFNSHWIEEKTQFDSNYRFHLGNLFYNERNRKIKHCRSRGYPSWMSEWSSKVELSRKSIWTEFPVCSLGHKSPVSHPSSLSSGHRHRSVFLIYKQLYSAELINTN